MRKYLTVIICIVLIGLGVLILQKNTPKSEQYVLSIKDGTYVVENTKVTLVNGVSSVPMPVGASAVITRYFGNENFGDLNNDGSIDSVFLLTQTSGGSGTFYYVAAALGSKDGFTGTNSILLGDRIAPQTIEIQKDLIIVNYVERLPNEPMSASPSIAVSKYFKISEGKIIQVQDYETKITYSNATDDLIVVNLPFPGAVVGKKFSVLGKARGNWFFEASFPVVVLDKNGNVLASGPAEASGNWMTTDFVPFKIDLKVPESYMGGAVLLLKKDNPSGLKEGEASISFPIIIEY